MKKLIKPVLSMALALFIFSACGGGGRDNDTQQTTVGSNAVQTQPPGQSEPGTLAGYVTIGGRQLSTALTSIVLDDMYLTDEDILPLRYMVNLTFLRLQRNQVTDLTPLAGLTNLTDLRLTGNQISDVTPLAGLTNLRNLLLADNQITDISPLVGLINLGLSMEDNPNQLTGLNLGENQVADWSPVAHLERVRGRPDNWQDIIAVAEAPAPPVTAEPTPSTTQEPTPPVTPEPGNNQVPAATPQPGRFVAVAGGGDGSTSLFRLAIDEHGSLWDLLVWTPQEDGSLRNLGNLNQMMDNIASVSAGSMHVLVLDQNGGLWMLERFGPRWRDEVPHIMDNIVFAAAGTRHSLAIDQDGRLWAWGAGFSSYPEHIMDNIIYATGGPHGRTYAIDRDGVLWQWASDNPVHIADNIVSVSRNHTGGGMSGHTLAIDKDGNLLAWGNNTTGQMSNDEGREYISPVRFALAANYLSLAVDQSGRLWVWGTVNDRNRTPRQIMDGVVHADVGLNDVIVADQYGNVWRLDSTAWLSRIVPVRITGN